MNDVVTFLMKNPVQFLATADESGTPKVRPFQFMVEKEGKLYFCTSNQKDVYREIKRNPRIALCACSPDFTWIRISGIAQFSSDIAIKKEIIEHSPLVASIYKTPDNPVFEIFYLTDAKAVLADFSGQPPKEYSL